MKRFLAIAAPVLFVFLAGVGFGWSAAFLVSDVARARLNRGTNGIAIVRYAKTDPNTPTVYLIDGTPVWTNTPLVVTGSWTINDSSFWTNRNGKLELSHWE